MAATPLATLKRVTEKLGYRVGQHKTDGPWSFVHDSVPAVSIGDFSNKRDAYHAAIEDYSAANNGNVSLEGL